MKQKATPSRRDDRNTRLSISHAAQRLPAFVDRPVRDGYSLKKLTQHFVLGYFRQVPAGLFSLTTNGPAQSRSLALKLTLMGFSLGWPKKRVKPFKGARKPYADQFSISRLSKRILRRFRFPLPYLPPLQGYNRWGRVIQAKAWAKFPRPFGPKPPSNPTHT